MLLDRWHVVTSLSSLDLHSTRSVRRGASKEELLRDACAAKLILIQVPRDNPLNGHPGAARDSVSAQRSKSVGTN